MNRLLDRNARLFITLPINLACLLDKCYNVGHIIDLKGKKNVEYVC